MAHDVLDFHNRVIHQNTHHQRQRQQGDDVDRKTQQVHTDECRNHRHRQRHSRHKRGTPVAQEQPHHQHRQRSPFVQQMHGTGVFLFHRFDEVEGLGDDHTRVLQFQVGQGLGDTGTDVDLTHAPAARHFKTHHRFAV